MAHGDKLGTCGTTACGLALRSHEANAESNTQIKTSNGFTLQCFPNPVQDVMTIELDNMTEGSIQIDIMDLAGRVVNHSQQSVSEGFNIISLDIQNLSKGLHIVRVKDGKNQEAFVKVSKL